MYWKMSIDLSYPLVVSMGHQAPLDGFITYNQLQATTIKDIEKFWLEAKNIGAISWTEHLDINMVMLATSLAPDGYLAYA